MLCTSLHDIYVLNANADLAQLHFMCVFEHTSHQHIMQQ